MAHFCTIWKGMVKLLNKPQLFGKNGIIFAKNKKLQFQDL
jgi:hypothetical protein